MQIKRGYGNGIIVSRVKEKIAYFLLHFDLSLFYFYSSRIETSLWKEKFSALPWYI